MAGSGKKDQRLERCVKKLQLFKTRMTNGSQTFHCFVQLLCLIGEAFDEDGDDICGAAVDVRPKADKISVWTADCAPTHKDRILNIG